MAKSLYFITFIFILSVASLSWVQSLDCSNVIRKENEGVLNWLGNITFTVPIKANGWSMDMLFDEPFTGVGAWTVWVKFDGPGENWVIFENRDDNSDLEKDEVYSFRFRVNYHDRNVQPQVTSLKFMDIELCR